MLERQLDTLGWDVIPSSNAHDALAVLNGIGGDVEAVLTDLDLPGMSGLALSADVRTRFPEVHVVLMSGASPAQIDAREAGAVAMLRKPFAMSALSEALSTGRDRYLKINRAI